MADTLRLDGRSLTIPALMRAAHGVRPVTLCPDGLARMAESRAMLLRAVAEGRPIYGVTTGLGARSGERLTEHSLAEFSVDTIRGRAHAVGQPEAPSTVRAAMIVRLNTLLTGYAAASPDLADHLLACLNAGLTPVVPTIGSVGAGDLTWNACLALGLIGEAPLVARDGSAGPGDAMLRRHGIPPWHPGPRDGLAIVGHSCGVVASAAASLFAARRAFDATQTAAALSMVAFEANLTPFRPEVLACAGHPAQQAAAADLLQRLAGSALAEGAPPRRLQDPLSLRNIPQIHGTVVAALDFAEAAVQTDLNGCSDNPVALVAQGDILSSGAFFTAHLTNALETVSRAFVHLATAQVTRTAKLVTPAFSGLPLFLAPAGATSNGFAPVLKTAEALLAELSHAAQPVAVWPSVNANGVEDVLASSPVAARALTRVADLSFRLTAIEMMIAAQASRMRDAPPWPGQQLADVLAEIREVSAPLGASRPLGGEIEALAERLQRRAGPAGAETIGSTGPATA